MIKAKLGASILSYMCPPWNDDEGVRVIEKTAKAGFDLIEILLPESMLIDTSRILAELNRNNIGAVCGLNLSSNFHIPTHPREAAGLIKLAIDKAHELESDYLGGVLHSAIGVFSGARRTADEERILFDVWNEVGEYALGKGVTLGIEPINRYESYVCTGAEETLDLICRSGAKGLALHLDTFHMNIEESDFFRPVILAKDRLVHVHMTDSDRGMLGEGNVDWDRLFMALNEIDFEGRLVLENFSNSIQGMAEAVSLWRPSRYCADDLAKGSLEFMKHKLAEFSK